MYNFTIAITGQHKFEFYTNINDSNGIGKVKMFKCWNGCVCNGLLATCNILKRCSQFYKHTHIHTASAMWWNRCGLLSVQLKVLDEQVRSLRCGLHEKQSLNDMPKSQSQALETFKFRSHVNLRSIRLNYEHSP